MQNGSDKDSLQPLPVYEAEIVDESAEKSKPVAKISNNTDVTVSQKIATAASLFVAGLEVFKKIKNLFGGQNSDCKTRSKINVKRIRRRKKGGE